MLTMTQIHDIRKLYFEEGKNIAQISRDTGYDRKTVRMYLENEDWNEKKAQIYSAGFGVTFQPVARMVKG